MDYDNIYKKDHIFKHQFLKYMTFYTCSQNCLKLKKISSLLLFMLRIFILQVEIYLIIEVMNQDIKTFRFVFRATLGEFFLNAPNISSMLVATWKRSSQSTSTTAIEMIGGRANFNQTIDLLLNMYYQVNKQQFQDKKTMFTFTMNTPKGDKQAGVVYIQLSQIINKKLGCLKDSFVLDKCPVKDSRVHISIVANLVGEGPILEAMSVQSSILTQSVGPSRRSIESKGTSVLSLKQEQSNQKLNIANNDIIQKNKIIQDLQKQINKVKQQKEELSKSLQDMHDLIFPKDQSDSDMRQQLLKSKATAKELQSEVKRLRSQNSQHEKQIQSMRARLQQIYQLLQTNLNSFH